MFKIYLKWLSRRPREILLISLMITFIAGYGLRMLEFDSDYKVFFSENNPQLIAFEEMQTHFSINDNILVVIIPEKGDVFNNNVLAAIEQITAEAWKIPASKRVDSLANFQFTRAEQDQLIVENLYIDAKSLTSIQIEKIKQIAFSETDIKNRLISANGRAAGINISLHKIDALKSFKAVQSARALAQNIKIKYPGLNIHISGMAAANSAFVEVIIDDLKRLIPFMYILLFTTMLIFLCSWKAVLIILLIIALSSLTAIGLTGWIGIRLNPATAAGPAIIMTLAVADCVHILSTYFGGLKVGYNKNRAISKAMWLNLNPIFVTSITTAAGFLCMNFSDAPPLRNLGNITAIGVICAFFYAITVLPALLALTNISLPVCQNRTILVGWIRKSGRAVVRNYRILLWTSLIIVVFVTSFIPFIELNDDFINYFQSPLEFRDDTDVISKEFTGIYQIGFALPAAEENGISNPEYLKSLERFSNWFKEQPGVVHVSSISDIIKRLNMNMNNDNPDYYCLPDKRELAAQYLLLYEMSLPFGLELDNFLNFDKSISRFSVTVENMDNKRLLNLTEKAEEWLQENEPEIATIGIGPPLMFANIAKRNIANMLGGTFIAGVLISFFLVFSLKDFKLGMLSLVPNIVPMLMTFGIWSIFVGQAGLAISIICAISIGIVVDDTVHFLSKYQDARVRQKMAPRPAIRYAYMNVGTAMVITSAVLVAGFLVLTGSCFTPNIQLGAMTAMTITFAVLIDLILLPALLLKVEEKNMISSFKWKRKIYK
jgi:uncharacterized protein